MQLILLLSGLIGCCAGQLRLDFLDFRPLSVRREKNLKRYGKSEKLHVLECVDLINRHGYPAEEYPLTTLDGYRLRIHRIPGSPKSPPAPGKPVVFLQHGLFSSSDQFVLAGPDRDLAFLLADAGYDVWLGNARGNTYSRSHVHLSPDHDQEFWLFSQHEIALYDTTCAIDHILNWTGRRTLVFVAHSMGTSIGMILLSTMPEYNEKIELIINMATIGYWKRPRNFMKLLKENGNIIRRILMTLRISEVFPQTLGTGEILNGTCRDGSIFQSFCTSTTRYISGYSPELLDTNLLAESFSYFPAGGSTQTLVHFHQNMVAGKMQMFDYGVIGNFAHYRQMVPPIYNLQNIVTPIIMIYGKGDAVAAPEDTMDLMNRLRYARAESVPNDNFGHLDFIYAKNIKRLLQDRIMEIIEKSAKFGRYSVL